MKPISLLLFFVMLFIATTSRAQSVGLVLSGGGAKGIAHIGVIRTLEENNIPIDYIAGTSMGAIIGGLYAAGYTPDEMEELIKSDDFYFWSTGKIQKEYRYYFMQQEQDPSWIELQFKRKEDKLKVLPPTNLIPDDQMDFAFMELFASTNAACGYNFNKLMVPFFCVAADLYNNKPTILRNGDLGAAIRASMTIPLVFKPISIDGNLLFDGGILNNFPTDIMKEVFNPDIIIGHKVADDMKAADSDDLLQQVSNLVMRPTNFKIAPSDGILLETKFEDIGLLEFNKANFIVKAGQETAKSALDSIKGLIQRSISTNEIENKRADFNRKKPELYFQNIQIEGVKDPMQRKFIIQSIKHRYNVITLNSLKKEYFKLIADDHIKSILPVAQFNRETGYFDLNLKVEPNKKAEIKLGGNLSTKSISQGFTSFYYRNYKSRAYTLLANSYFGRFYNSLKVGGRIDYPTLLPLYLAAYSTFNRWDFFSSSNELFFEDTRPSFIIQRENNHRIEAGFPLGLHGKFFTGLGYSGSSDKYYLIDRFNKFDTPDQTTFRAFFSQVGIEDNSLNYRQYPTEGWYRYFKIKYISGRETNTPGTTSPELLRRMEKHRFFQLEGHTTRYFKITPKMTLGLHLEAVASNRKLFKNYLSSMLTAPGFYPTPHSKTLFINNFHAYNYAAGGLSTILMFTPALNLRLEGYGFVPVKETLKNGVDAYLSDKIINNYYFQGEASLIYQTMVGPLSLSCNYYDKANTKFYFSLNFGYILFNKRGF